MLPQKNFRESFSNLDKQNQVLDNMNFSSILEERKLD